MVTGVISASKTPIRSAPQRALLAAQRKRVLVGPRDAELLSATFSAVSGMESTPYSCLHAPD